MQLPELTNPWALLGLLLVIPIILIYFLKPKPKRIKFPTIMFITKLEKDKRFRLFPKRFMRDPLLILQILGICFLVLAIANPSILFQAEKRPDGNIVLVMDASASMQSVDVYPGRFMKAKELAGKILDESGPGSSFSIVMAENMPVVVLKNADKGETKSVLDMLTCADTPTNIGDSILFAKDMLSDVKTNRWIYVFSDFSESEGMDIDLVSKLALKDGIDIKLIKISEGGNNVAITDIDAKRFLTNRDRFYLTFTLQNFNHEEITIGGKILLDGNQIGNIQERIPGGATRLVYAEDTVSREPHVVTVRIDNDDDLAMDNEAYVVIPGIRRYKVLLITDDDSDTYLEYALKSSPDVELTKAVSPIIPEFGGFDTIVQGEMSKDLVLKGMYGDIKLYMEGGGNLIVLGCNDLGDIENPNLKDLLPIELEWIKNLDGKIEIVKDHEILGDTTLEGITVKKYFKCGAKNGSEVIAKVAEMPLIAYHGYGKGRVVYVGINPNPSWSNFYYSSSMPIFWFQLIRWVNRADTATTIYNFKTGDSLPLNMPLNVTTPSDEIVEGRNIVLDETGIYETQYLGGKEQIAVNLANERESDIARQMELDAVNTGSEMEGEQVEVKRDIYPYLLSVFLVLLVMELIYYIRRGYFQQKT
jgi:hypothetical protein